MRLTLTWSSAIKAVGLYSIYLLRRNWRLSWPKWFLLYWNDVPLR